MHAHRITSSARETLYARARARHDPIRLPTVTAWRGEWTRTGDPGTMSANTSPDERIGRSHAVRITVGGLKGGVGKTTTAAFLATALAKEGPTLAVDADPQSQSLFDWYQLAIEGGFTMPWECHPWSGDDLARRVRGIADRYEHVVIDTGGETSRLFRAAVAVAGELVIPVRANPIEMRRIPATLAAAAEVEDLVPGVEVYPRVLLVCTTRARDARDAREFLASNVPPVPTMTAQVRQGVAYPRAFGTLPADLGDYLAVVEELKAAAA